jgi:uroporphyrin-III C-methyltransferase/precorrin-2 dehydrogenase/sirohydrochlorin ferrochelatase
MSADPRRRWQHPIFIDVTDRPVVVVGGGNVATRKIETLIESGARITVVSPELTDRIAELAAEGRVTLRTRPYQRGDLEGFRLAYAATSDSDVNKAVRDEARAAGIWLNAIDQPALCDFITPAIVRRGNLTIAISTNGRCPEVAKQIRLDLDRQFGPDYAVAVEQLGELRTRITTETGSAAGVETKVADVLAGLNSALLTRRAADAAARSAAEVAGEFSGVASVGTEPRESNDAPGATTAVAYLVTHPRSESVQGTAPRATAGTVYLVGAGPGDPELITVKGRRLLECADTVVYDALVDPRLLELCPPATNRVYVGKRDRHHTRTQSDINNLLVEEARAGRVVVRLKGGDPFIFGRGGEEAEALVTAGIAYEVVPGVSAGVAVPAYAGIPLTHRGVTGEVVFLTGHESETARSPVDWARYAPSSASLVIFMGCDNLGPIAQRLMDLGRDPQCPVAVIENGTTDTQRTIVAPLATIAVEATTAGLQPPALIVVGEVVRLRDKLRWFEPTREDGQAE